MRPILFTISLFATLLWVTAANGQPAEAPNEAKAADEPAAEALPEDQTGRRSKPRGFVGGLLGAGIAPSEFELNRKAHIDASLLFALRGGLLLGAEHLVVVTFELAPMTNKIDWSLRPTTTFLTSAGKLRKIGDTGDWAWLWKVGAGVGGGLDYGFLVGGQLDLLTFNYKISEKVWIDFGAPSIRFYTEISNTARHAFQFVLPLGVTFAT